MPKPRPLPVKSAPSPGAVGRRSVLRGLATGVGAGVAIPGLAGAHPLGEHAHHPERIAEARAKAEEPGGTPQFLDAYQLGMLESLGERIVPGSAAAGCARFVDSLLAVGDRDDAQRFLSALGALDAEARRAYGRPWPELDEAGQVELLRQASTAESGRPERGYWTPGTPVADYLQPPVPVPPAAGAEPPRVVTLRDHFEVVKQWVVGAYYSSEAGQRELGYDGPYFAESFPGCTHEGGHRES